MDKSKLNVYKWLLPLIILLIIISITVYKIIKNREDNQYSVLYGKIEYAAKNCFIKKECPNDIILNDLYEKGYIKDDLYDPITKEIIDKNLKIHYQDDKVVIDR